MNPGTNERIGIWGLAVIAGVSFSFAFGMYRATLFVAERKNREALSVTEERIAEVQSILNESYRLYAGENSWPIERATLASWLSLDAEDGGTFTLTIAEDRIRDFLIPLVPAVAQAPVNEELGADEGRNLVIEKPGIPGLALNVEESIEAIRAGILAHQASITLFVTETPPKISKERLEALGITKLLGRGESDFAGSPNSRMHNIRVGSTKYHGMLLAPNEEFSFNTILGNVGPEEGYLPELVIKKDKTIPEYGGGLCQVSTTLFRAVVRSGLDVTRRFNHSFAVRYYGTPGFDATIYPPDPDLKFKNDTGNWMYIKREIEGTKLTFEIFGAPTNRTVQLEGPYLYDEQPDGSLKAWLEQQIFEDGQLVRKERFYSVYKSPALYPIERNPLE